MFKCLPSMQFATWMDDSVLEQLNFSWNATAYTPVSINTYKKATLMCLNIVMAFLHLVLLLFYNCYYYVSANPWCEYWLNKLKLIKCYLRAHIQYPAGYLISLLQVLIIYTVDSANIVSICFTFCSIVNFVLFCLSVSCNCL